ncbi:MAG TPA: RagB/SusD family nutrient uptake outer membrane protein [Chitinophagaceae bacterium]|nr:RagB/SusD family nutrient uptake outer membrane protein [Chitinophagaceae bacterium]
MTKITIKIKYLVGLFLPIMMLSSCKKDFLERPPTDAIVDANFYKTDEQLAAATSLLYNRVWFDFNENPNFSFGDIRAGTAFRGYNERGNVEFNTTDITPENRRAWSSLFTVVGQSNLVITNIGRYAGAGVSEQAKNTAIAEARFMRAVAYRYLTMIWGEVPIIENNLELLNDPTTNKHTIKSIWRFLTREMRAVAENLPAETQPGRVNKWSAEGMLARFYLARAGAEATGTSRNQTFLDSAKYYSQRVINQSGKKLMNNYADLFKYPYDNNQESLFELQWVFLPGGPGYNIGNGAVSHFNPSSEISAEGWGGDKAATWWMLSLYEGFTASGDTMLQGRTTDQRLKATFMLPGFSYPEITRTVGGVDTKPYLVPFTVDAQRNFANIKKYTVGQGKDIGIPTIEPQRYPNNTYMLRLAEMYLIYAEATLGNNASTSDATALQYFNAIRTRAGLPAYADPVTGTAIPLTLDAILNERFKEFAIEGMAWYDLVRLHYWNPQKAYSILNAQDRGFYYVTPDNVNNASTWTIKKTPWATAASGNPRMINANSGNFRIPIPAAEMAQAPWLSNAAVDYP